MKTFRYLAAVLMCLLLLVVPEKAAAEETTFTVSEGADASGQLVDIGASMEFKVLTEPSDGKPGTVQVGTGDSSGKSIDVYTTAPITIPTTVTYGTPAETYSVAEIGDYAFYFCEDLPSITIPDSVTIIGEQAFYHCKALNTLTIPNTVTEIGELAFYNCKILKSITIPASVTSIGSSAFAECEALKDITIPDTVTSIGDSLFSGCSSLESYKLPSWVKDIGSSMFARCSSLKSITIPEGATSIGYSAFSNCTSLKNITIPDTVTSIGDLAFSFCTGLTSINIPDGVKSIESSTFSNCDSLTSITIPDNVSSIKYSAFSSCTSLKSINIPDNVSSIEEYTFSDCESLTSINIPDNVASIKYGAFSGCDSLTSITIPAAVKSIATSAFDGCDALGEVYFQGNYIAADMKDGVDSIPGTAKIYVAPGTSGWNEIAGVILTWVVETDFTNISSNGLSQTLAPLAIGEIHAIDNYSTTLTPDNGYLLPDEIDITVGGKPITEGYTYNKTTGELTITNTAITGDVNIKVRAISLSVTEPVGAVYKQNDTPTALTYIINSGNDGSTLIYQWYKNSNNTTTGSTLIDGETKSSYTPSTATVGTTYYYCTVTETLPGVTMHLTSSIVEVKVNEPDPEESSSTTVTPTTTITPTTPTVNPDTGTTTGRVEVKPTTQGTTTEADIGQGDLDKVVEDIIDVAAESGTAPQLELDVDTSDSTETLELTLPAESLNDLAKTEDSSLTVKSDIATVTFDQTAMQTIIGEMDENGEPIADEIVITVSKASASDLNQAQQDAVGDSPVYRLTVTRDGIAVHDFLGGTVTVTIPYIPTGLELGKNVAIFFVDSLGNLHRVDAIYDAESGTITFTTKHFSYYMVRFEEMSPVERFNDLNEGDWYTTYVEFAYDNGLMQGVSDTEFSPNNTANRAMLWTVLARIEGVDTTVADGEMWYATAKTWAIDNGISDGTDPEGDITREQFVTMLYRLAGELEVTGDLTFTDSDMLSDYAENAMIWAVQNGVISGYEDNTLKPQGKATRAEIATMLQSYMVLGA